MAVVKMATERFAEAAVEAKVPSSGTTGHVLTKTATGTAWQEPPGGGSVTLDDTVTETSAHGVKSSGIWSWVKGLLPSWLTGSYAEPATTASVAAKLDRASGDASVGWNDEGNLQVSGGKMVGSFDGEFMAAAWNDYKIDLGSGETADLPAEIAAQIGNHNSADGAHAAKFAAKAAQAPTFTEAATLATVNSGEACETMWGKVKKAISSLISHFTDSSAHSTLFAAKQADLTWKASTAYAVGVVVLKDGVLYRCETAHTSATSWTTTEQAKWSQFLPLSGGTLANSEGSTIELVPGTNSVKITNSVGNCIEIYNGSSAYISSDRDVYFNGKRISRGNEDNSDFATMKKVLPSGAADYAAATAYTAGQTCWYDSYLWMAKQATTGNAPADGSAYWLKVVDLLSLFTSDNRSLANTMNGGSNAILQAGSNITLTQDATTGKVTVAATGGGGGTTIQYDSTTGRYYFETT